jgi:hypothetical protein
MEKFYIYLHIRKTDNVIFYVGKGHDKRAWCKRGRNKHWKNTVKNHGLEVKLIAENLTEEKSFELEKIFIEFYGRKDKGLGTLVNWTDGGEGASGTIVSEDTKKKQSLAKQGVLPWNHGKKGVYSEESKRKIGDKTLERLSNGWINPMTNRNHTEETKQKQRDCKLGKYDGPKNPNSKKIIDNKTGVIYDCVKDLSNLLGKNYGAFIRTLKNEMEKGICRYSYV